MVSKTTLYNRINGRRDQALYGVTKQRLTSEEEKSIENWGSRNSVLGKAITKS